MNANDVANRNLQHRVRMMAHNSEGYIEIRQRFLEQNNDTESSSSHGIIRVGNAAAHKETQSPTQAYTCPAREQTGQSS